MPTKNEIKAEYDSAIDTVEAVLAQAKHGDSDWDFARVTSVAGETSEEKHEAFIALNTRLGELGAELDKYQALEEVDRTFARDRAARSQAVPNSDATPAADPNSPALQAPGPRLGASVMNSAPMKAYLEHGQKTKGEIPDVEMNTLMGRPSAAALNALFSTTTGWAPERIRIPGLLIDSAQEMPTFINLLPTVPTTRDALKWMEETVFTPNVTEIAEGGDYPDATFLTVEREKMIQKYGTSIEVTDEQLADVAAAEDYLESRIVLGISQRLSIVALNDLIGNANTNEVQLAANASAITKLEALLKIQTAIRIHGQAVGSTYAIHPSSFEAIRLTKNSQNDYMFGPPSAPAGSTIFGRGYLDTAEIAAATILLGQYRPFCSLGMRQGIEIAVTDSHGDNFTKGIVVVRADVRAALAIYRGAAFGKVTNF